LSASVLDRQVAVCETDSGAGVIDDAIAGEGDVLDRCVITLDDKRPFPWQVLLMTTTNLPVRSRENWSRTR
jgi:hypothetical protein